jgi:hypothetical protein
MNPKDAGQIRQIQSPRANTMDRTTRWLVNAAALISGLVSTLALLGVLGGSGPVPGWVGFVGLMVALVLASYANVRDLRAKGDARA